MLQNFLLVAVGGSMGAMTRYAISLASVQFWGDSFPWGTFLANSVGCLAMGFIVGIGLQKDFEVWWLLIGVGVLGSLTTFSTFSAETIQMALDNRWAGAVFNACGNVFTCLVSCFVGIFLARTLAGS